MSISSILLRIVYKIPSMALIVLGMTGGISAYKSLELLRELQRQGHMVEVIMTDHATKFITPLTVEALLGKPVHTSQWKTEQNSIEHIALAKSDLVVIAPATANTLAKFAHGIADNLLTSLVLASQAPLLLVPAMNPAMYSNSATQENLAKLRKRGCVIIEPESGLMACGDKGIGRFPAIETIVTRVQQVLDRGGELQGKKIVITTGGTREYLDPVRYLGNESSGTMGYELAKEASALGAEVTLLCANCSFPDLPSAIKQLHLTTTQELLKAVCQEVPRHDVLIMAAAVADYTPTQQSKQKIKKQQSELLIKFQKTPDILQKVQEWKKQHKKNKLITIGFAAETENVQQSGKTKLKAKGLDFLIANKVPEAFGQQGTISGYFLSPKTSTQLKKVSKKELATMILSKL